MAKKISKLVLACITLSIITPVMLFSSGSFSSRKVFAKTNSTKKAEADRILQQGIQKFDSGKYEVAKELFQESVEIYEQISDPETERLKKIAKISLESSEVALKAESIEKQNQPLEYNENLSSLILFAITTTIIYSQTLKILKKSDELNLKLKKITIELEENNQKNHEYIKNGTEEIKKHLQEINKKPLPTHFPEIIEASSQEIKLKEKTKNVFGNTKSEANIRLLTPNAPSFPLLLKAYKKSHVDESFIPLAEVIENLIADGSVTSEQEAKELIKKLMRKYPESILVEDVRGKVGKQIAIVREHKIS